MSQISLEPVSEFGRVALSFDELLHRFERLVDRLEGQAVDSDKGHERAVKILADVDACRVQMEIKMRELVTALAEVRERNEKAVDKVATLSVRVQARSAGQQKLVERFRTLGQMAQRLQQAVSDLKASSSDALVAERSTVLKSHLPEVDGQLQVLIDEATTIAAAARSENMRSLEKDADAVGKSLRAARNRLHLMANGPAR
jgi:hypothetical protein